MLEDEIIRLGIEAAKVEVQGGDSSLLLAHGLHRLLDADAGVGIGRWSLALPANSGRITSAGVPSISAREWGNLVKWAPRHPLFLQSSVSTVAFRLSDEVPLAKFWDTEVWWHIHGIRDGKYPVGIGLGLHDGQAGLIGIHRRSRDFSDDEMVCLSRLQEPLQSALKFRASLSRVSRKLGPHGETLNRVGTLPDDEHEVLTPREKDVLVLVATGRTNSMIGSILGITERTVRKHLTNAYAKLKISNRTSAAIWYHRAMTPLNQQATMRIRLEQPIVPTGTDRGDDARHSCPS